MAFTGMDGFQFGIGVVEDRHDPKQLGRVRVRWLGLHTEEKDKILTKDLPWSEVMQSAGDAPQAGVGTNATITEGTWVCGFSKDPGSLQDWIIMGTLPGWNVTTAIAGSQAGKWAQYRGEYKEFVRKPAKDIPGLETKYLDYEKGFHDPTVDQENVPHPPSPSSWRSQVDITPGDYVKTDFSQEAGTSNRSGVPNVPGYDDLGHEYQTPKLYADGDVMWEFGGSGGTPRAPDTDFAKSSYSGTIKRATHSDTLHALFCTTRRITADKRFAASWTDFGTFRWPDNRTYSAADFDTSPKDQTLNRDHIHNAGREGVVFSTGYLEPKFTASDQAPYGLPTFPILRDRPTRSFDSLAGLTDTRPSWGKGNSIGDWTSSTEDYRIPHPRVRWVAKGNLTPTESDTIQDLFKAGQYGSGVYNVSDGKDKNARKDIKWADVKNTDLVVVPVPDTNPLAMGGVPITAIDPLTLIVTTDSSFFGSATESKNKPTKPKLQVGDIVQLAGVRGMQEVNGRIYRVTAGGIGSMTLGTLDGAVWSGPGDTVVGTASFSEYLGGGVVIPHNPHWMLAWKADMRERQINIGSPNFVTGVESGHWNQPTGDFGAQYPYNHVYETESGHIMEYDDTPGAERIHQFHRSGTHYEIDHNGTKVDYVKGDNYDIRIHDDYMYVKGKVAHTFDDEVMIRYNDRADISAKWKLQLWSGGDLEITSKRNINLKSDGDINLQAGGHINMNATAVTPEQSEAGRAGSRISGERSKIRMKAGHLEVEAIGDETRPDEYGISMQSNQAGIMVKTLTEARTVDGDRRMTGDINIASAADMNLYAHDNHYREAATANIEDFAYGSTYLTAHSGDMYRTAQGVVAATGLQATAAAATTGNIYDTAYKTIGLKSAVEDIELWALREINIKADSSGAGSLANSGLVNIQTTGNSNATTGHLSITTGGAYHHDVGASAYLEAVTDINLKSTAKTKVTGSQIHFNSSGSDAASAATPTAADAATAASGAKRSYFPNSLELLSIDLPLPRPADGTSISMLALSAAKSGGYGGENIRNLHDTISEIKAGTSAYGAKSGSASTSGRAHAADQGFYNWDELNSKTSTQALQGDWTGTTRAFDNLGPSVTATIEGSPTTTDGKPLGHPEATGLRKNPSTRSVATATDTKTPTYASDW